MSLLNSLVIPLSQSSTAISSADLFGHDMDDSGLDLTASDLINRISFQVRVGPYFMLMYYTL